MADRMVNKTVRLSKEQIRALEEEGQRDRREFSALVRIAVDELLQARRAAADAAEPVGTTEARA